MLRGTLGEIALTSLAARVHLMFQTRAVLQVLRGRDGGWPPTARDGVRLTLAQGWAAAGWIALRGLGGTVAVLALAPGLAPMPLAPVAVAALSAPTRAFATPEDLTPPAVPRRARRPSPPPVPSLPLPRAA